MSTPKIPPCREGKRHIWDKYRDRRQCFVCGAYYWKLVDDERTADKTS